MNIPYKGFLSNIPDRVPEAGARMLHDICACLFKITFVWRRGYGR